MFTMMKKSFSAAFMMTSVMMASDDVATTTATLPVAQDSINESQENNNDLMFALEPIIENYLMDMNVYSSIQDPINHPNIINSYYSERQETIQSSEDEAAHVCHTISCGLELKMKNPLSSPSFPYHVSLTWTECGILEDIWFGRGLDTDHVIVELVIDINNNEEIFTKFEERGYNGNPLHLIADEIGCEYNSSDLEKTISNLQDRVVNLIEEIHQVYENAQLENQITDGESLSVV